MIVLKSDVFVNHERLTRYIKENNIKREDILSLTASNQGYAIFFYADESVEEITHGMFS